MKLDRVEVRRVSLPLGSPFETSVARMTAKEFLLVSVSADGVSGHGECVADVDPFYLPETNATVLHVLRSSWCPLAFGLDIAHPREVAPALSTACGGTRWRRRRWRWRSGSSRPGARGCRCTGSSAGGAAPSRPASRWACSRTTTALPNVVAAEVEAGYRRVKVKIKPGRDLELVRRVRERFPDLPLMVDANSAYTLDDADHLRALDRFGLMMIEQPLAWDDIVDHVALQARLETPLCLDESIRSPDDARHALGVGCVPDHQHQGGTRGRLHPALGVHDAGVAAGAPVWCGGMVESGIGRLANVHLQTLPGFTLPGDTSASCAVFAEDLVDPPVVVAPDGTIAVPEKPGIGHEIVWPRVERATRFRTGWSRP